MADPLVTTESHFLMSSERSGSTLISRIIGSHPEFCSPATTHLFRIFGLNLFRYGDLSEPQNRAMLLQDLWDLFQAKIGTWQLDGRIAQNDLPDFQPFCPFRLIHWLHQQEAMQAGKSRLFIKENNLYQYSLILDRFFPQAKYIYLVRDPRDMALSWKKAASLRGGIVRASHIWQSDQQGFLRMMSWLNPEQRVLLVRYEDLIAAPESTVSTLCRFLEIDFHPAMLTFYEDDLVRANAQAAYDWQNTDQPVIADNAQKYQTELRAEEGCYVEAVCAELMPFFNYPLYFTHPGAAVDQQALHAKLSPLEPYEKPQYQKVSESERETRARWHAIATRIAQRSAESPRVTS